MSAFKNLFAKKEKPPTPQEAIQKIREVEDLLAKKQGFLEKKIEDELAQARKHGTKNKRRMSFSIMLLMEFQTYIIYT